MKNGFTLVELIIVVVIISIITSIALSNLLRAKMAANEGSTIGTLKSIFNAQAAFQNGKNVDQNNNGIGEFGVLGELTGSKNLREEGNISTIKVDPPFITKNLAPKNKYGIKNGYVYIILLPAPKTDEQAINDENFKGLNPANPDENEVIFSQEAKWRCYAWPFKTGGTGIRCFGIDNAGEVITASNLKPDGYYYSGTTKTPRYNAATPYFETDEINIFQGNFKEWVQGHDGQIWKNTTHN